MLRLKKQVYRTKCSKYFSRKSTLSFTMVEIIVSLAILSTSILAIFGVLQTCLMANSNCSKLTESVLLAESLLSETMLQKTVTYQTLQGQDKIFNWEVQVAPTDIANLSSVCVRVKWLQQQRIQEFELFTLLYLAPVLEGK